MIKENINSNKGITLVSLVVSIIILLILSTISIQVIRSSNNISPYNNMVADINLLEDKISVYYNKYGEIPKTSEEIEIEGIKYYKIDLSKLENVTLNFGTNEDSEDYYLVNNNLEVYYKRGIEKDGEIYHSLSNNNNYNPDIEDEIVDTPQTEYTELEYIETTGTQYIDLQYVVKGDLEIEGEVYTGMQAREMCVVGVAQSGAAMEVGFSSQPNRFFAYSKESLGITPIESIYNNKIKFNAKFNAVSPYKELTLNNSYSSSTETNSNFVGKSLQLFRLDNRYYYTGRLYYLKIYDNKSLVRDFIPCKDPDGIVCLYEKVEDKYYYNQGTGDFITECTPQTEYKELEYIETTGTQYVDLQHIVRGALEIEGEVYTSTQGKEMCVVGVGQSSAAIEVGFSSQPNRFFAYSKESLGIAPIESIYNNKIKFNAKFNAVSPYKELTLNNSYSSSTETNSSFVGESLQLFRVNTNNTKYYYIGRLYYLKIYDNKSLVRDLIPYKDPKGIVCLYEKVEDKYYYAQGAEEFIAGPEV